MFLAFLNPIKLISHPALFFMISRVSMGPSLVPCRTALPPSLFAVFVLEWEDWICDRSEAQGIYVASKWFDVHQHLFVESGVVGIPYSLGCSQIACYLSWCGDWARGSHWEPLGCASCSSNGVQFAFSLQNSFTFRHCQVFMTALYFHCLNPQSSNYPWGMLTDSFK